MNKRTLAILQRIDRSGSPLSIDALAKEHDVSTRTIRNDVTAINRLLGQNGLDLLSYGPGGLIIKSDTFSDVLQFVDGGDFYQYKLSRDERKMVAAALLINSPGYITLATIADTLYVSRSTIIHDLDGIKAFIGEGNLEVISHPNKGLLVAGSERDKRLFLMRISDTMATEDVPGDVGRFISVESGDRILLRKIVREQERVHGMRLTDVSFTEVVRYLGILVNRNLQSEYIEHLELDDGPYLMAMDILKYVSQYCSVTTTEDEIRFFSHVLACQKYSRVADAETDSIRIQLLCRRFIERVSEELGVMLADDYEFFEALSNHLISFFSAEDPQLGESSVIDEVMATNVNVADVVREQIAPLSAAMQRDLNEIELGYVVVHVCAALERKKNKEIAFRVVVACHAGVGTSHLLVERLKKHFNFQIVDIISSHEAADVDAAEADLVISTVPLSDCKVEWVVVSPLLSDEDYLRVGNKIDALRSSRNLPSRTEIHKVTPAGLMELIVPVVHSIAPEKEHPLVKGIRRVVKAYLSEPAGASSDVFAPYLHHLLTPEHIQLDVEVTDWRDAVRLSAAPLVEAGYVEPRYVDAIVRNIEKNGPYVVISPGFAMPHDAPEEGTTKMGMNLIRLRTPVEFGADEFDPVEFVCCLSATDHKLHLKAFFNLVNLLQTPGFKDALREAQTPADVSRLVENWEYRLS